MRGSETGARSGVRRKASVVLAIAALLVATPAFAGDCFAGLRRALARGGYQPADCRNIEQTVTYVGRTRPRHGPRYDVYMLHYKTVEPGLASHYGDRILIFDVHRNYLGHYHLGYGYRARIVGADVLINVPANKGNRIHLVGDDPPESAWLDEDVVGFGK